MNEKGMRAYEELMNNEVKEMAVIVSNALYEYGRDLPSTPCPIFVAERLRDGGYTRQSETFAKVVRCIDCEYCKFNSSAEIYKCDRRGYLETVMPNDFCSKGKAKGE